MLLLVTTLCWLISITAAISPPAVADQNLLVDTGCETLEEVGWDDGSLWEVWEGYVACQASSEIGVSGSHRAECDDSYGCQVVQYVDLNSFADNIDDGTLALRVGAWIGGTGVGFGGGGDEMELAGRKMQQMAIAKSTARKMFLAQCDNQCPIDEGPPMMAKGRKFEGASFSGSGSSFPSGSSAGGDCGCEDEPPMEIPMSRRMHAQVAHRRRMMAQSGCMCPPPEPPMMLEGHRMSMASFGGSGSGCDQFPPPMMESSRKMHMSAMPPEPFCDPFGPSMIGMIQVVFYDEDGDEIGDRVSFGSAHDTEELYLHERSLCIPVGAREAEFQLLLADFSYYDEPFFVIHDTRSASYTPVLPALGTQLLLNPGAELDFADLACDSQAWIQFVGSPRPNDDVIREFPEANRGFLGYYDWEAAMYQKVDISAFAATIDAGEAAATISVYLGGVDFEDDGAEVEIRFYTDSDLTDALDGGYSDTDVVYAEHRDYETGFVQRWLQVCVPVSARYAKVTAWFYRSDGVMNDASADWFTFYINQSQPNPTPELGKNIILDGKADQPLVDVDACNMAWQIDDWQDDYLRRNDDNQFHGDGWMYQMIDISPFAALIDAGDIEVFVSAALGALYNTDEWTEIYVEFYEDDEMDDYVTDIFLSGPEPDMRNDDTGIIHRERGSCWAPRHTHAGVQGDGLGSWQPLTTSIAGARYIVVWLEHSWPSLSDNITVTLTQISTMPPNLIKDHDAETGKAAWIQTDDQLGIITYDDLYNVREWGGDPAVAACPGWNTFVGPGDSNSVLAHQLISICQYNRTVDAGGQTFHFSAMLGGNGNQPESFTVTLKWILEDGEYSTEPDVVLGPVTAEERLYTEGFVRRTLTGVVPTGARIAEVTLSAPGVSSNDAMVDQMELYMTSATPTVSLTENPHIHRGEHIGPNLIVNGDAEGGNTSSWSPATMVATQYASTTHPGVAATHASPTAGNYFFDATGLSTATIVQTITVPSEYFTSIDAGSQIAELSAWIGGKEVQLDVLAVTAILQPSNVMVHLRSPTLCEREGHSGLMFRNTTASVPALTRSIQIIVEATALDADGADVYIDDIFFGFPSAATPIPPTDTSSPAAVTSPAPTVTNATTDAPNSTDAGSSTTAPPVSTSSATDNNTTTAVPPVSTTNPSTTNPPSPSTSEAPANATNALITTTEAPVRVVVDTPRPSTAQPIPPTTSQTAASAAPTSLQLPPSLVPGPTQAPVMPTIVVEASTTNSRNITIDVTAFAACGSTVQIEAFVEARISIAISPSDVISCRPAFPGVVCTYRNLDLITAGSIQQQQIHLELLIEAPSYYGNSITFVFTAACLDNVDSSVLAGSMPIQDGNGTALPTTHSQLSTSTDGHVVSEVTTGTFAPLEPGVAPPTPRPVVPNPTPAPLQTTNAPPPAARISGAALGIFGFQGQQVSCLEPLFGTWVAFIIFMIAFFFVRIALGRRDKDEIPNTHEKIPQWRSLAIQHPYMGMFLPCHAQCVFIHIVNPFSHVLAVIMSAAVLVRFVTSHSDDSMTSLWIYSCIAIAIAQPWKHMLQYFYDNWTYDPKELEIEEELYRAAMGRKRSSALVSNLRNSCLEMPASKTGLENFVDLSEIELVEEYGEDEDELPTIVATADDRRKQQPTSALAKKGSKKDGKSSSFVQFSAVPEISSADQESDDDDDAFPVDDLKVTVQTSRYILYGHGGNAVFAVVVSFLTYALISAFGREMRCDRFVALLWRALALDAVVLQSFALGAAWIYRWMTASATEPLPHDKKEDKMQHKEALWSELHPFQGDRRRIQ